MATENPQPNKKRKVIAIIYVLIITFVLIIIGASIFWGW